MTNKTLYLYRLSQTTNTDWDTYDSFIVAGYSEGEVRGMHPTWDHDEIAEVPESVPDHYKNYPKRASWPYDPSVVKVELIGIAGVGIQPGQVLCSSFNAG